MNPPTSTLTPSPAALHGRGTGNRTTRILGVSALVSLAVTAYLGLVVSPPDVTQGELVRLIYVHPAVATVCYVGFGICALSSAAWLWPRTRSRRWDALAGASAEVGVVFCALTPGDRFDLGSSLVGRVVDVGCPPDTDRTALRRVRRVPRPASDRWIG